MVLGTWYGSVMRERMIQINVGKRWNAGVTRFLVFVDLNEGRKWKRSSILYGFNCLYSSLFCPNYYLQARERRWMTRRG